MEYVTNGTASERKVLDSCHFETTKRGETPSFYLLEESADRHVKGTARPKISFLTSMESRGKSRGPAKHLLEINGKTALQRSAKPLKNAQGNAFSLAATGRYSAE